MSANKAVRNPLESSHGEVQRINYCRREKSSDGVKFSPCGEKIEKTNALNWCQDCRKNLPFWPRD